MKGVDLMNYNSYLQQHQLSYVRILHASPDAPSVDVLLNNMPIATDLKYRGFTEYLPVYPGRYNVKVFPTGNRTNAVIDSEFNVLPESIYTVAATGMLSDIGLLPIIEPRMPMQPGVVSLKFGHLSPNAPRVDLRLSDGTILFRDIGFNEVSRYISLTPGTYTLEIYISGTNQRVLYVPNVNLRGNRFYSVYAIGIAGGTPPLQVLIPLDGNSYL